MKGSLSPIVQRCAGEVVQKPKRSFSAPTEVCLEDWWLSKPDSEKGIAVSGIPFELRRCNHARKQVHSAPAKKRYSLREFHSSEIVKRHGCTTVETSDGLFVSLCGFINRSRTLQNGFSSEVCRDFIYGFPFNWEVSAAQCVGEDSSETDGEYISKRFLPPALDVYNGAQLHDLVLSLTDGEREAFNKTMYDNVMGVLSSETLDEIKVQPSKSNLSSLVDADIQPMTKPSNKRGRNTLKADYTKQEREIASVSQCRISENWPHSTERNNVEGTEDFVKELQPCQKPGMDVTTSRKRVCRSVTKDMNSGTEPQTPDSAQRKIVVEESTAAQQKLVVEESTAAQQKIVVEESTEVESAEMESIIAGQSEVRRWLKNLTSAGINLSGQGRRLCHELKNLLY